MSTAFPLNYYHFLYFIKQRAHRRHHDTRQKYSYGQQYQISVPRTKQAILFNEITTNKQNSTFIHVTTPSPAFSPLKPQMTPRASSPL